jgi:uncharacterized protein (TIGR03083 family)
MNSGNLGVSRSAATFVTSLADRTIAALRTNHDDLAALVPGLSTEQLTGPSGASEWSAAQVLSHMGSGAEISLAGLTTALTGGPDPAPDFNQSVWDRWNALSPQEQADSFIESNARLIDAFEAISPEQRESVQVKLGFLPFPLQLAAIAGMRLNESAQHSWDVRVALDPQAGIAEDAAGVLAEQLAGPLSFMPGFFGKAEALAKPAVIDIAASGYGFVVADAVSVTDAVSEPTATFTGPLEAAIRLVGGRLTPKFTPEGVEVTGNVTLDDLRRVFPGF